MFFWKKVVNFQKNREKVKKNNFFPEKWKKSKKSHSKNRSPVNFSEKSFELSDKLSIFCFIKAIMRILRRALGAVNCFDIFVLKRLKGIGPNGAPLRARLVILLSFQSFRVPQVTQIGPTSFKNWSRGNPTLWWKTCNKWKFRVFLQ